MKRLMTLVIIVAILVTASGYAKCEEVWPERDALICKAQELSERMSAFARSDAALGMFSGGWDDIDEIIKSIASYDFDQPTDVLVFLLDDALVENIVNHYIAQGANLPKEAWFPDALKAKLFSTLPGLINGQAGAAWMSACSRLYMMDLFTMESVKSGAGCVILSYPGDQPSVAVSFCISDDSAVVAYATYLKMPDDMKLDGKALIEQTLSKLENVPDEISKALSGIYTCTLSGEELLKVLEQ